MPSTIEEAYPDLIDTGSYIRFQCKSCGEVNGSTVHSGADGEVAVCGNCWTIHGISELREV